MHDNFDMQAWRFNRALQEIHADDHEVAMALASLRAIISNASQLMSKIGTEERNLPGWIQDHITNAENYIEQANQGFHELNENTTTSKIKWNWDSTYNHAFDEDEEGNETIEGVIYGKDESGNEYKGKWSSYVYDYENYNVDDSHIYNIEQVTEGFYKLKESKNPHLYQIKGILVTNTEKRTQGDILSDMRSIPGVTIVTPKDYKGGDTPIDNRRYTVELSIKIDPHPFTTFGKEQVKAIIAQVKRVDGVISYRPSNFMRRISETGKEI